MKALICTNCGSMNFTVRRITTCEYSGFEPEPIYETEFPEIEVFCSECDHGEFAVVPDSCDDLLCATLETLKREGIQTLPILDQFVEDMGFYVPIESKRRISVAELRKKLSKKRGAIDT